MARKIPSWQRQRVGMIDSEFRALASAIDHEDAPLVAGLENISSRIHGTPLDAGKRKLKASYKTLVRLWYDWEKSGRKATSLLPDYSSSSNHSHIMPDLLINEIQRLASNGSGGHDKHGKGLEAKQIWTLLSKRWHAGMSLPGIGTWKDWWIKTHPSLALPTITPDFPWTPRTVSRKMPAKAISAMGNHGMAAALKKLPHMDRDYSKLRKCELYTLDDVRLDFVCLDEITGKVVSMTAYILMEVASRTIVAFVCKPENNIKAEDVDELLACGLQTDGFGLGVGYQTHIWFERGTIACSEAAQRVLESFSDGALKIHRTSMDGGVRWIGAATDKASGHSAGKAAIESFNRNLHRRLMHVPGQRGNNFANQPANLGVGEGSAKDASRSNKDTIAAQAERLAQFKLTAMAAGADAKLKLPLLTSSQAQQVVAAAIRDHNNERGHTMQGFHTIMEAEIAPNVWREVGTI
jgi:hypothetical protein